MFSRRGFTLYEMLLSVSIIAIFSSIAIPSMQTFLDRFSDGMLQSKLLHGIQLAHHEAVAKGVPIVMCKSKNQRHCAKNGNSFLIFIDENNDGIIHRKENLLAFMSITSSGQMCWRSFPFYREYLLFFPNKIITNDNGTFWYCRNKKLLPAWAINLSRTGQTRVVYPDQQGEIKDGQGKPLRCVVNFPNA